MKFIFRDLKYITIDIRFLFNNLFLLIYINSGYKINLIDKFFLDINAPQIRIYNIEIIIKVKDIRTTEYNTN